MYISIYVYVHILYSYVEPSAMLRASQDGQHRHLLGGRRAAQPRPLRARDVGGSGAPPRGPRVRLVGALTWRASGSELWAASKQEWSTLG